MPNTANINRLLDVLKHDDGTHFRMQNYATRANKGSMNASLDTIDNPKMLHKCGTAFCVAGWANAIRMRDRGEDGEIKYLFFSNNDSAADWLGIGNYEADSLFHMQGSEMRTFSFDRLPPAVRKGAAIEVLTHIRDHDEVDWDRAIAKARHDYKLAKKQKKAKPAEPVAAPKLKELPKVIRELVDA